MIYLLPRVCHCRQRKQRLHDISAAAAASRAILHALSIVCRYSVLYAVFTGRRAYDGSAYCSGHLLYSVLSINIYIKYSRIFLYFFGSYCLMYICTVVCYM